MVWFSGNKIQRLWQKWLKFETRSSDVSFYSVTKFSLNSRNSYWCCRQLLPQQVFIQGALTISSKRIKWDSSCKATWGTEEWTADLSTESRIDQSTPVAPHYIMEKYSDKEHVTRNACDRKEHVTRNAMTRKACDRKDVNGTWPKISKRITVKCKEGKEGSRNERKDQS